VRSGIIIYGSGRKKIKRVRVGVWNGNPEKIEIEENGMSVVLWWGVAPLTRNSLWRRTCWCPTYELKSTRNFRNLWNKNQ